MPDADAVDIDAVTERVLNNLDPGSVVDDKVILSRRQFAALAGGGVGVGALLGLGSDEVAAADGTQDTSAGQVGVANGGSQDVILDQLRDPGGDVFLNVDDTGAINGAVTDREWRFGSVKTSNETTIAKIERDSRETQFDDTSFNAVLDVVGSSSGEIMITRHSGGSNSPQLAAVIFAYWSADNSTNVTAVSEQVNGTDRGLDVQWSGFTLEVAQRGVTSPGTVTVEPRAAGADYTWQI
jgi:hypothetical protein